MHVHVLVSMSMSMSMSASARRVGTALGLKWGQHFFYDQALAAQHLGQHRVGFQLQSACL